MMMFLHINSNFLFGNECHRSCPHPLSKVIHSHIQKPIPFRKGPNMSMPYFAKVNGECIVVRGWTASGVGWQIAGTCCIFSPLLLHQTGALATVLNSFRPSFDLRSSAHTLLHVSPPRSFCPSSAVAVLKKRVRRPFVWQEPLKSFLDAVSLLRILW